MRDFYQHLKKMIDEKNITDEQINELYRGKDKGGNPVIKLVPATTRNKQIFDSIKKLHKNGKLKERKLK